ncbi:beta-1,6-N-acetylglucosaminyltransferase [Zoogloea sp.]|uniref:beta-1,6-N-acetylglucosaminyltransferase n=1 Tax=Zoogloea sp. TaxID=49181 RepID=UPI0031FE10EB
MILNHQPTPLLRRLLERLRVMFDGPPIVCHHDFSKCGLPEGVRLPGVSFVSPSVQTGWGLFSIVEASLLGIEALFRREDAPDWFVLLSAADYPLVPARVVRETFASAGVDAFVSAREVNQASRRTDRLNYRRYLTYRLPRPGLPQAEGEARFLSLSHPWLTRWLTPFSGDFRCYFGSQWFSANRHAAERLLRFHRERPALAAHYLRQERFRSICPDESYLQTILLNDRGLRIGADNLRYMDWEPGSPHPRVLTAAHLPAMLASGAHFGRKFDTGSGAVLDLLDRHLDARGHSAG